MENAVPKYMFNLITDITPDALRSMGVRAVGIDLDNTTVYDFRLKFLRGVPAWITHMKQEGFLVCIVTNTFTLRAAIIGRRLHIPYFAMSDKPKTKNIIKAAEKAGVDISEFAMIGDRLFADVLAANDAGAVSIKTEPFRNEKFMRRKNERNREKEAAFVAGHRHEFRKLRRGNSNDKD